MVHRFRLIHYNLGCALTCTKKKLPTWYERNLGFISHFCLIEMVWIFRGFEQDEVTCNPNKRDPNAIWNIEENIFPRRKTCFFFSDCMFNCPIIRLIFSSQCFIPLIWEKLLSAFHRVACCFNQWKCRLETERRRSDF